MAVIPSLVFLVRAISSDVALMSVASDARSDSLSSTNCMTHPMPCCA